MHRIPRFVSAGAAAAAVVLVALGGCSDDDGGVGPRPDPGPTSRTVRVPQDFATIREAVAAAAAGDTILLGAGTYSAIQNVAGVPGWIACVDIQKPLTLRGSGASTTVIGSDQAPAAIFVKLTNPGTVRIEQLTAEIRYYTSFALGIIAQGSARLEVFDCAVRGTCPVDYNGLGIASSDSSTLQVRRTSFHLLEASVLVENHATGEIANCTFEGNGQNIIVENEGSNATVTGCSFRASTEGVSYFETSHCGLVEQCSFQGMQESAVSSYGTKLLLLNCTVVDCGAALAPSGPTEQGGISVVNSILWSNAALFRWPNTSAVFTNSCVEGGTPTGTDGGGNISAAPMFVAQAAGDLSLQAGSPCIDSGALSHQWECAQVELTFTEFVGSAPDMGATEQ